VTGEERPRSCCFDERAARNAARARKRGFAAPITRALLTALQGQGLRGVTFLDVGCGIGDLALAALRSGAARADGIDLGAGAIEQARALAAERGVADRVTFVAGDGAVVPLARHDVVALNRVLCCYPNVDDLLANSLAAAGSVYAYTAPIHTGPLGVYNRIMVAISNAWFRLREAKFGGFQAFVHDLDQVDRRLADAGFRQTIRRRRRIWRIAVFTRA
jgi:SAM-dependent methyltransferase